MKPLFVVAVIAAMSVAGSRADAQLMGAHELPTNISVKGVASVREAPDIYYFAGQSGAKETFTLAIKGPASLTLFSPDGHELVAASGSGTVTLRAVLNLDDVFTLAVSRLVPNQSYTLKRSTSDPTLAEWSMSAFVGYTLKSDANHYYSQCWVKPGVKYRTKTSAVDAEITLAADRETTTGETRQNGNTPSFERTYSVSGGKLISKTRWSTGIVKEASTDLRPHVLDDGRTREFTGYLCKE